MDKTQVKYFASGYCEAHARIVNPKEKSGKTRFYAVWALINLPGTGNILFDTGYSDLFRKETSGWPECLYRMATPVTMRAEDSAVNLLKKEGIDSGDIAYVIISHFHADHMCAIRDFPNAKFICSEKAVLEISRRNGFDAVRRGMIKKFLPNDFFQRLIVLETISKKITDESGLDFYEFFDQTELRLVALPGHAAGMLGFYHTEGVQKTLYASDAAWHYKAFKKDILPMKIVKLFFDSWSDFEATHQKLKRYLNANPETKILFTHCPGTLKHIKNVL
jgi:glyoxylase-like metal-dependent hydrolase (beta-lactamase superfamily II)